MKESGLRIEDAVQGDSGIYVCIATNGFGTAKLNITLSVVGKYITRVHYHPRLMISFFVKCCEVSFHKMQESLYSAWESVSGRIFECHSLFSGQYHTLSTVMGPLGRK